MRVLIVGSETPDQRAERRRRTGAASDEAYARTLTGIEPACITERISCIAESEPPDRSYLQEFDGIVFAGSSIHMHRDTPATRAAARFMGRVFEAGTPCFGSCAGMQIAAVAAGGSSRPCATRMEAAFARGLVRTEAGRDHPLLAGRPVTWDAPAMHADVVDALPANATVLARTRHNAVEALEIRHGAGVFWGVQYHPEISVTEIAAALRRDGRALVEQGLAADEAAVEDYARTLEELAGPPPRRDRAWQLGVDEEITDDRRRTTEIRNFLRLLAGPAASGSAAEAATQPLA